MANETLKTLPASKFEALALLYIQKQDLSGISPEQLLDMYEDAYQKIKDRNREKHSTQQQTVSC